MAAKSRMEKYRREIRELINCGASISSTWKIINSTFAHKTKLFFGVSTDNSDKVLQFF